MEPTRRDALSLFAGAFAAHRQVNLSRSDEALLEDLARRCFLYFWENSHPETGIARDRARRDGSPHREDRVHVGSIASTGFALAGLAIAEKRGWEAKRAIRERVLNTLRFHAREMPHERGWFYHFVDTRNGERVWKSELSSIDTALLTAGALTVRQAMSDDREIVKLATAIYERIDFPWMRDGKTTLSHGWRPESGFIRYHWDHYSEHPMLYLMGIGSPTHPIPPESWWAWTRDWNEYAGYRYLGRAGLFTHQYSHAYVDFRGRRENREPHVDYFENSVKAMRAHRRFCIDLRSEFPGYSENVWGISASDSRKGYVGWKGPPRDKSIDGSVVPYASIGALMFTPDIALPAIREMKERFGQRVYSRYGFAAAFDPSGDWVGPDVVGIDVGISLLSIENFRSGRVWSWFMKNREIPRALDAVGLVRAR
jgi:hypothetical protein